MAEEIKVPGVGPVKKPLVFGGIAVLVGVLAVAYYRHSRNASAAASSASAAQPDPNAIDPATGLTYGEEAAGIQAGDLAGAGTPYGDTSGIIGYDAQGNPVYSDQVGYGPTPNFVNNAAWSQAAQQYLVASTGADAGTVAAALGAYLAGQPLTTDQASVVQQAIAFFGQPPQAGSNGYPPSLNIVAGTGGTGGTTGSGGSGDSGTGGTGTGTGGTSGTGSSGGTSKGGPITATPVGLHTTNVSRNSAQVAWIAPRIPSGQGPLTGYGVEAYDNSGHPVNGPFTVAPSQLYANIGGLKSKTKYHVNVWCDPARSGGPHATVSFTTK